MSTTNPSSLSPELINAITIIGDAHILCIISKLGQEEMRFCELQRAINGLNPTTLTDRLKRLEKENIVSRKKETLDKVSVVYELTEKGKGILPIIHEIGNFADQYLK